MGAENYGDLLTRVIDARNETVQGLAKKIAARRGTDAETERGKLKAYRRNDSLPDPDFSELLVELLQEPRLRRAEKNRRRLADSAQETEALWDALAELRKRFEQLEREWAEVRSAQADAPPRQVASGPPRAERQ